MRMRATALVAALTLLSAGSEAARKVEIRVVPRPVVVPETAAAKEPVPYREPMDPFGPFSSSYGLACLKDNKVEMDDKPAFLDFCHLKNITIIEEVVKAPEGAEIGVTGLQVASTDSSQTGSEGNEEADAGSEEATETKSEEEPTEVEPPAPPMRKILGIYKGWHIDPIHKNYKHMIFDDGDECTTYGKRNSITAELVPLSDSAAPSRIFGFRKIDECTYFVKVEAYVPDYMQTATQGIHSSGVIDISDPEETINEICSEKKCMYSVIKDKVEAVRQDVETVKQSLEELFSSDSSAVTKMTLDSASAIIKSTTGIMERAIEMLEATENLQHTIKELQVGVPSDPEPKQAEEPDASAKTEEEAAPEVKEVTESVATS
ncbi:hypothetical protein Poli38472_006122 [Pythium oligandrum]|uniref:Uncharacterized protein n=1 Tax=Pythium oligandrum TaxID=41045 RepID=A0A8K1FPS1_PYTOL|nr:hypothetical protein Poli38472_006122 [Pythium oligandrum]|eukprot:TMW68654.1 hypothetical protein Poli38472_006122 [Pythium oligandrum]